jgi:ribosome-associated protein
VNSNREAAQGDDALSAPERVMLPGDVPPFVAHAVQLALDRKARDVLLLDLRGLSNATDYFVIASGTSDLHVRAIAENIIERLKAAGESPDHVEGLKGGRWVLIDYVDFVVHVFHPASRDFYQLERLWGDAPTYVAEG